MATKAIKITEGVEFDTIAREWRLKWCVHGARPQCPINDSMASACMLAWDRLDRHAMSEYGRSDPKTQASSHSLLLLSPCRSADSDKASLAAVQKALVKVQPTISKVAGLKSVQRVVCGGCLDYKVGVRVP